MLGMESVSACFFLFSSIAQPIPQDRAGGWRGDGLEAPLISEPFYNSQLCTLKSQLDSSGILLPLFDNEEGDGQN